MTYQLRLRPQVESDIEETALWYEERQAGLGGAFVHEVGQAINALKSNPLLYPVRHRRYPIRWMFPKRFPLPNHFRRERGNRDHPLCDSCQTPQAALERSTFRTFRIDLSTLVR